eukprot:s1779_g11.t1
MKLAALVLVPCLAIASKLRAGRATCDAWSCSDGYVPKLGAKALEGASDEECCLATCKLHDCSAGFVANTSYDSNTGASDAECCDKTCSGALEDGSFMCGTNEKVGQPDKAGASAEECCEATCAAYDCTGDWSPHPSKMNSTGSSDEECCVPLCMKVACDSGYILDQTKLEEGGTKDDCCVKSCDLFTCDAQHGFGIPPQKRSQQAERSEDCCERQCRSHVCSDGWTKDHTHDEAFDPSDETCCLMQCQSFQCPAGWISNPAKKGMIGNTAEICCLPPCDSHNCSAQANMVVKDGAHGRTDEACCEKTCAAHSCSNGLVAVQARTQSVPGDDATCCEVKGCEEMRKLTKLKSGESCNALSKEDCGAHFGSFVNSKKRAVFARCDFDRSLGLCRLSSSELDCVDQ